MWWSVAQKILDKYTTRSAFCVYLIGFHAGLAILCPYVTSREYYIDDDADSLKCAFHKISAIDCFLFPALCVPALPDSRVNCANSTMLTPFGEILRNRRQIEPLRVAAHSLSWSSVLLVSVIFVTYTRHQRPHASFCASSHRSFQRKKERQREKKNFLYRTLRWEKRPHAIRFPQTPKVGRKRNDTLETKRERMKDREKKKSFA